VIRALGDPAGQVFLITVPDATNLTTFIGVLLTATGIADVESDLLERVFQSQPPIPQQLYDTSVTPYFGVNVRSGYLTQSAVSIVGVLSAQSTHGVSGAGTVAVIDTGSDPSHPVLAPVLVPGYDFTRNQAGYAPETADVTESTVAVVDGVPPIYTNNYSAVVVDQTTANSVDNSQYDAFGHGTMVSGIVHLVAPTAKIMPLKAFGANGSGYTSDIIRAVYWAVHNGARIVNMSFSMPQSSHELTQALNYATNASVICVAAAGNQDSSTVVYPAGYSNVMGVASTDNNDVRSVFSNYGPSMVWLAAPGEGVITTYPWATYAAAWGTSFSAPFVSGTVSLLLQEHGNLTQTNAASALTHAIPLTPDLNYGRLNINGAIQAVLSTQ
jgi:thermitase